MGTINVSSLFIIYIKVNSNLYKQLNVIELELKCCASILRNYTEYIKQLEAFVWCKVIYNLVKEINLYISSPEFLFKVRSALFLCFYINRSHTASIQSVEYVTT